MIGDQNVASGRANDFHQGIRLCAGAYCADMAIERAAGDSHRGRDAEFLRPFAADAADWRFRGLGLGKQRILQMFG
jgi:hypothetical protein